MNDLVGSELGLQRPAMNDRPPILAFLALFTVLLAVVLALAALNEALGEAEPAPMPARPETPSLPHPSKTQERAP